jgi:antitoxin ParD1/3/4
MQSDTISLDERERAFVAEQIANGRFASAVDVVRAGLRLLELEQRKLEDLRQLIADGDADLAAGRSRAYQPGDLVAEIRTAVPGLSEFAKPR